MTTQTQPSLEAARSLLNPRPQPRPSVLRAFLASVALALAGVWLALIMLVGPLSKTEPKPEPATVQSVETATPVEAAQSIPAGSEGGFELSATPN